MKDNNIHDLLEIIQDLRNSNQMLTDKFNYEKSIYQMKTDNFESLLRNIEEEKVKMMEQMGLQEKQLCLMRLEISSLKEKLELTENEKNELLNSKTEMDRWNQLRLENNSDQLLSPTLVPTESSGLEEAEAEIKQLATELSKIKEELQSKVVLIHSQADLIQTQNCLIQELSQVNKKLEFDVREASFLLEAKNEEVQAEDTVSLFSNSIFLEKNPLFSIPKQEAFFSLFQKLSDSDLAKLNRPLNRPFDIHFLVSLSNSIIESVMDEINLMEDESCLVFVKMLKEIGNLRILLNEYTKLYYEAVN